MQARQHRGSSAIVDFISRLSPLYIDEHVGGQHCARSLRDGSLICPVAGPEGDEEHWVEVLWHGDGSRRSMVHASRMAIIAINEYAQFHSLGVASRYRDELEHLIEHFELKTGSQLRIPGDQLIELIATISKLAKKLGWVGLLAALKALT